MWRYSSSERLPLAHLLAVEIIPLKRQQDGFVCRTTERPWVGQEEMLPFPIGIYLESVRTLGVDAAVPHSVQDDHDFLGTGLGDVNPLGPQGWVGMVLSQPPLKQGERVDHVAGLVQAGNLVLEDGISWFP